MKAFSDEELVTLLADIESDRVERKESFRGDTPAAAREALCAFANDLPGHGQPGVLFIGVRDDGAPSGLAITDELLRQLADMKTDGNIIPPPTLTVEKRTLRGSDVAVVTVWPADAPPVRCKGRIHIRVGPRRALASAQDERILNEKRRHADHPFDVNPVRVATLADLDRVLFENTYQRAAVAPDVLAANDRSYEQRLAATKMVVSADEPVPTVVGMLVVGMRPRDFLPGAYVQFMRIDGTGFGDPIIDAQLIDGSLTDVIRRIDDKIASHNRVAVDISSGPVERRTYTYPPGATQQLVRNAIMHRSYEGTNAPVHVRWFDDRLEILSPGGPYGAVSIKNFGTPGLADYRNPDLTEAMRVLGFVQRYGVGIGIARQELAQNGSPPPAFAADATHVLVTLRCA